MLVSLWQSSALPVQPDVAICALYGVDTARLVADTARKLNASTVEASCFL